MIPIRDRLPTRGTPIVTYALIVANIVAFLGERTLIGAGVDPQELLLVWGLVPARLLSEPGDAAITLVSSMFMHDPTSWSHLGFNMLFLWIFGDNVEDAMGHVRYAMFYVACGLAAAIAQVAIDPSSHMPMVGASGAISGVLAAYGSLYPRSPITVLNPFLPLWFLIGIFIEFPAWVIILEYFIVNLFSGLMSVDRHGGGVAFFAHLGGFVAGMLLVHAFMAGRTRRDHDRWERLRPSPGNPWAPPRPRGYGSSSSGRGPWSA